MEKITLRQSLKKFITNSIDKHLTVEEVELWYSMIVDPECTKEEKEFAQNSLIADFLSRYNTSRYCQSNKTNTGVVTSEDLDQTIAMTILKAITCYKSDGGTSKDNFLRYCIAAINNELQKQHKISLPFYFPHTTKKQKDKFLNGSKKPLALRDEQGLVVKDKNGKTVYLKRRIVVTTRDGTKCNRTLEGQLIDVKTAADMDDDMFEQTYVYDNTSYYGLKTYSISAGDEESSNQSFNHNKSDFDITESMVNMQVGDYQTLHSKCWDNQLMKEDLIKKILEFKNGEIVYYKYGLDRGYGRTTKECSKLLNKSKKYINYWSQKVMEQFKMKYPDYGEVFLSD